MSKIVNYKTGRTVTRQDYVDDGFDDIYQRSLIESSTLPCIYSGFHVSVGSGLNVLVSPGKARGQDLAFIINENTSKLLPTIVEDIDTATTVTIPANSLGWIVLNVNVWSDSTVGPSSNGDLYQISATTSANIPPGGTKGPMFVTSLQPNTSASWPYTQIVLAAIESTTSSVNINSVYNPMSASTSVVSNRSFSWEDQVKNTTNNGNVSLLSVPETGTIAIPGFINNLNTNDQRPLPTLSWKYGRFDTYNNGSSSNTGGVAALNSPFQNKVIFAIVDGVATGLDAQNVGHSLPVTASLNSSNSNSTFIVSTAPPVPIASLHFLGNYLVLGY